MDKVILAFVGMPGSGKDTVTDYLRTNYGLPVFKLSQAMNDCLDRLGVEKTRANVIAFSEMTRERYGQDLYARVLAQDCRRDPSPVVAVNNVRRLADISAIKDLPGFRLVRIVAPPRTRYERMLGRGEKSDENGMSWEKFMETENAPTEASIPEVEAVATLELDNSGTFAELYAQVDKIMAELKR